MGRYGAGWTFYSTYPMSIPPIQPHTALSAIRRASRRRPMMGLDSRAAPIYPRRCVLGQTVNAAAREGLRRRLRLAVLAPWSLDTFVTSSAINTYMYIWLIHVQVPTATGASYLSPSAQPAGGVQVPTSFRDLSRRRCGAPGHSEFGICPMILYVSHPPTLSLIQYNLITVMLTLLCVYTVFHQPHASHLISPAGFAN